MSEEKVDRLAGAKTHAYDWAPAVARDPATIPRRPYETMAVADVLWEILELRPDHRGDVLELLRRYVSNDRGRLWAFNDIGYDPLEDAACDRLLVAAIRRLVYLFAKNHSDEDTRALLAALSERGMTHPVRLIVAWRGSIEAAARRADIAAAGPYSRDDAVHDRRVRTLRQLAQDEPAQHRRILLALDQFDRATARGNEVDIHRHGTWLVTAWEDAARLVQK